MPPGSSSAVAPACCSVATRGGAAGAVLDGAGADGLAGGVGAGAGAGGAVWGVTWAGNVVPTVEASAARLPDACGCSCGVPAVELWIVAPPAERTPAEAASAEGDRMPSSERAAVVPLVVPA